jgi:hypothetical protein
MAGGMPQGLKEETTAAEQATPAPMLGSRASQVACIDLPHVVAANAGWLASKVPDGSLLPLPRQISSCLQLPRPAEVCSLLCLQPPCPPLSFHPPSSATAHLQHQSTDVRRTSPPHSSSMATHHFLLHERAQPGLPEQRTDRAEIVIEYSAKLMAAENDYHSRGVIAIKVC